MKHGQVTIFIVETTEIQRYSTAIFVPMNLCCPWLVSLHWTF